ncbi:N-acetyltransferase [Paenibacillus psychroresistens]|uniref:N-acetyltransferase n=1 Tax=Paenibacillus psychroresistens TaxID=1778678 RepID=A0A6B8RRG0_9BACL|nr:GNAT family N-acetyltransferase [Paenibacillus psychroresistens]QGQ98447.1 N-acetyltransferase [Paenibacillus psychroresistens]
MDSIELTGLRAKLTPLSLEHTEELYDAAKDPEIWTYLPEKIQTLEETLKFIEDALLIKEKGVEIPFAVIDLETNSIVGSTRLMNISMPNRHLEIGWTWYNPSVWRTRMNTECKYMLLKYCFEVLETVRVQFCADIRNTRSNQGILRLGAVQEGILRRNRILSDGYIRDASIYSIISEEWPSVKERLEHFLDTK